MLFAENGVMALESWVAIISAVCTVASILGGLHLYASRISTKQETTSTKVDGLDRTVQTFIVRTDEAITEGRREHSNLRTRVEDHHGRIGRIEGRLEASEP